MQQAEKNTRVLIQKSSRRQSAHLSVLINQHSFGSKKWKNDPASSCVSNPTHHDWAVLCGSWFPPKKQGESKCLPNTALKMSTKYSYCRYTFKKKKGCVSMWCSESPRQCKVVRPDHNNISKSNWSITPMKRCKTKQWIDPMQCVLVWTSVPARRLEHGPFCPQILKMH